jgi:hypothetical protein
VASAKFRSTYPVTKAASLIKSEVFNLGFSVELINEVRRNQDNYYAFMFVFEKFYYRAANRASLSVLVTGTEEESYIDCVSSGAGQGVLFTFSWGADKNFVNGLRKILLSKGYKEI